MPKTMHYLSSGALAVVLGIGYIAVGGRYEVVRVLRSSESVTPADQLGRLKPGLLVAAGTTPDDVVLRQSEVVQIGEAVSADEAAGIEPTGELVEIGDWVDADAKDAREKMSVFHVIGELHDAEGSPDSIRLDILTIGIHESVREPQFLGEFREVL